MATLLIAILIIIAIGLTYFKCYRTSVATLMTILVLVIAIGNGFIPSLLLKHLQSSFVDLPEPNWKNKNVIVLLGAGALKLPATHRWQPTIMAYSRINAAAQLYLACIKDHKQCTIIVSGGDALKVGKSEAEVYEKTLLDLGVKASDIILEANSMNTFQNAQFTSAILKKMNFDQVILVTSGIHLRRSLRYFSHFAITATPALADYLTAPITVIPIGYNFAMTDFAVHEYLGIVRNVVYSYLGWNTVVTDK